jgi:[ribosomal protein S5]-alanine N-acetyltransferase
MTVAFETARLRLRQQRLDDSAFVLTLLNDPGFLRHIGDRGVRTLEDAARYIEAGAMTSYAANGFGLWLIERKADGIALGVCGLVKRPNFDDVDVGYALLPAYRGTGYAREAVAATLAHARTAYGLTRLIAVVSPDNIPSRKLLELEGFVFERMVRMAPEEPEILLLARVAPAQAG